MTSGTGSAERAVEAGAIEQLGFESINVRGEHNAREESSAYPRLDEHLAPDQIVEVQCRLPPHDRS